MQAKKLKPIDPKALRTKLKLSQKDFWSPLGVTQSGGSRYENERDMPTPVKMLLHLAYGSATQAQLIAGHLAASV